MIDIGAKIKKARKEVGLTQKDMAEMLEVHWNTVARWERNEIECRIDQLHRIAAISKRPISWFFGGDAATEGRAYVGINGITFRLAREKNNYSVKEIAVLLELPEKMIKDIEKESAPLEMEYLHRMVFVLGYMASWFLTNESNKEWNKGEKTYKRWLDTGREDWKFQELFYNLWEQGKVQPKLGFDDMENWLKNSSEMWARIFKRKELFERDNKELLENDKKELENLRTVTERLSNGVKSETNFFLKLKKDRERQKSEANKNIKEIAEIAEIGKALEEVSEEED